MYTFKTDAADDDLSALSPTLEHHIDPDGGHGPLSDSNTQHKSLQGGWDHY